MKIPQKDKNRLIETYKAFYARLMAEGANGNLNMDQLKAVGQRVIDESIEKLFEKYDLNEKETQKLKKEFEKIIKEECPDNLFDSNLVFTEKGFSKK